MKISCKNVMHLVLMNLCWIFAEFWNFTNVNTLALELNVRSIPQCQFCLPQNLLKPLRHLIFGRHLNKRKTQQRTLKSSTLCSRLTIIHCHYLAMNLCLMIKSANFLLSGAKGFSFFACLHDKLWQKIQEGHTGARTPV